MAYLCQRRPAGRRAHGIVKGARDMDLTLPWRLLRVAAGEWLRPILVPLRERRRRRRERPRHLGEVYPALVQGDLRRVDRYLEPLLDARRAPDVAIEATLVKALAALAREQWRETQNIIDFMSVAFHADDCRLAFERAQRAWGDGKRFKDALALPANLLDVRDWETFAARARGLAADRLLATTEREHRRSARPAQITRPLVVVCITGGLGNQLFQYAAAHRYATEIGAELRIDLRAYTEPRAPREFLLPRLRVPITHARLIDIARATRRRHYEPRAGTDAVMLNPDGTAWLFGFWEDSIYFAGAEAHLRQSFQPADRSVLAEAQRRVREARDDAAALVGMHVRRGDRAGGSAAASAFPTLPTEYYRAATRRFRLGVRFLIFSDTAEDIEWCRTHLGLDDERVLRFADANDPILDFFTLASCDHLIISASTFSWWAAWLNPNPDKMVIMPDVRMGYGPRLATRDARPPALPGWEVIRVEPMDRCFAGTAAAST
jgi:hypothetical protein